MGRQVAMVVLGLIWIPTLVVGYFVVTFYLAKMTFRRYDENGILGMKFFQNDAWLHARRAGMKAAICSLHLYVLTALPSRWLRPLSSMADLNHKDDILKLFSARERFITFAVWTSILSSVVLCFVTLALKKYWNLPD
jgi:hypothetical protein